MKRFRFVLLVIAALSMFLTGLFIATETRSDAQTDADCPAGFNLTADRANCFQNAATTTGVPTCSTGQLTPDGSKCYTAARPIAQSGATSCPDGYSVDDSLGGQCARFSAATRGPATCPTGARGVPDSCYTLIAKGAPGTPRCSAADAALGGIAAGDVCVITSSVKPVPGPGTCPVSTVVRESGGVCYQVISPAAPVAKSCAPPYSTFGAVCKYANPTPLANPPVLASVADCPNVPGVTEAANIHTSGGITKVSDCFYTPVNEPTECTAAADLGLVNGECRRSVALVPGAPQCPSSFAPVGSNCVRYEALIVPAGQCPSGAVEATDGCRLSVANTPGELTCAKGTLNTNRCVEVTGFTINPDALQFACDSGSRSLIATADGARAICIIGDPTITDTVGCLRGVLSTDNLTCVLPINSSVPAAPVPGFTG